VPTALLSDRYRLGNEIGRGGMSTVYEGTDELLGRSVAIKLLELNEASILPRTTSRDARPRDGRRRGLHRRRRPLRSGSTAVVLGHQVMAPPKIANGAPSIPWLVHHSGGLNFVSLQEVRPSSRQLGQRSMGSQPL
jgi:serine/threonine protein kinase